jgi:uncharacterized protein
MREIAARRVCRGRASGPALVAQEPISFLGDLDIRTGEIVGDLPSVAGKSVKGVVLIMPGGRGSAGAWRFLYQLHKHGTAPVAIVSRELPDPSIAQGAILAGIPIVCEPETDLLAIVRNGEMVTVDADRGVVLLD